MQWQFWIDRGGTFTDVVARDPQGVLHTAKLLSSDPERYADAAVEAIRRLTGAGDGPIPPCTLRIGTTIATNALLERKGEPVLLAITKGFRDAIRIGYQDRPDLFARRIDLPPPLHADVVEMDERLMQDGTILTPLDEVAAQAALQRGYDAGLRAVAIVLMHGYRYPAHEQALARIARQIGFTQISVSHEVAPLIKLVGRGDTVLADAYLSPVLRAYVDGLGAALGEDADMLFMQSNGGLTRGDLFRGKDAVLSGPAGGIVGLARTAEQAGFGEVIGFDMGGTSTDVSHYAGSYERDNEARVAGVRLRAPMMRIHTIAAGGGSICSVVDGRFRVGPESAGAVPGPACYRRGGPLTITDCNVMLGKVQPDFFPSLFGPNGDQPLDRDAVEARFADICAQVEAQTGRVMSARDAAQGFIAVAVDSMANAIKRISVARGHDVARYTLASFGGAGGQHACLVADALGMDRVMIHPLGGVLSAYGMGLADRRAVRERTLALPLDDAGADALTAAIADLGEQARADLPEAERSETVLRLRYDGTDSLFDVMLGDRAAMLAEFEAQYQARFGYGGTGTVLVDMVRVEAIAPTAEDMGKVATIATQKAAPLAQVMLAGTPAPVFDRAGLTLDSAIDGPALISDPVSTTVVEPGWRARLDLIGNLLLTRHAPRPAPAADDGTAVDPVRLEVMGGLFMAIAEEMGAALQHSASSVNIRERLDFSCALFDATGNLVANAPHMPVHLGSMGESIRAVMRRRGIGADGRAIDGRGMLPGDVYALNAPYDGGTHLPDVTVVMPVFVDETAHAPAFYVAARGHHADIGGISPGSMPPDSRSIEEEGIVLDNVLVVDQGRFLEGDLRALLGSGRWPSRNIDQNIADLSAQIAACAKGAAELQRISGDYGADVVAAYMGHVQDQAEAAVRRLIDRLSDGHYRYAMDNGAEVVVNVTIDRAARGATVDFTGTSDQLPGNFNAPLSVARAALLYVVRTLVDEAVPMNDGCLKPTTLVVPEGSLLRPLYPAAVVAGNVETSQVVTDALFGALGVMAGAQGTMNNFTFGNARHQYYETISGGSGAGPDFDGADVVQTHMTNSRLTDPEILESRFPVLLEEFSIRAGSGGAGAHHGGNGGLRRIRFLEDMTAGILANRRSVPPFGLDGGAPGGLGRNWVERGDGRVEMLGATGSAQMAPGDVFVIETPGGGGFGKG
ncbi:hydantoinase B/oxoprolinase family protein [Sphingobium yanoikuyae]|uniref:Hydantoinase B/oxoprolinase family protein n=2 Tax=Sphingobium yanoikuyae TaxID=13690 RepID=A0AA42WSV3_SPHYA|nr:hydantoinase B/oxoprolinase family protein [Sphingobium yanoikuyae]MDH2129941.1 hydantoinase B/oxoprolinase family protein [Sphingobium yanoikuyae]MDH2147935.1 hydantoinase B/oxoprolinase family protein [Sphingobium yanoikuyae]MDH2165204.1 hydantoinase B/oxoprolinase family protein [Sphingobium yanoikuyae]